MKMMGKDCGVRQLAYLAVTRISLFLLGVSVCSAFLSRIPAGRSVSPRRTWNQHQQVQQHCRKRRLQHSSNDSGEEEDDDDDWAVNLSSATDSWRSFRAKLVLGEQQQTVPAASSDEACDPATGNCDMDGIGSLFSWSTSSSTSSGDPSQWAYDSGTVIEKGAVILGGVEQEFGFGLRQQYFHKAAILVLDHQASTFTKGILLNRPTDLLLKDDINPGVTWKLWFGGDVQGFNSLNPDIVCLHSLDHPQVQRASLPVLNDGPHSGALQWTSFDNAKRLVNTGVAKPTDFWVFCGYAGWGPNQLLAELDRKSWYMVATDSGTLLKELHKNSLESSDPRQAGLDTWTLLMNMIGRGSIAALKSNNTFDDCMLKEWARHHLLSTRAGGAAGNQVVFQDTDSNTTTSPMSGALSTQEMLRKDPVDILINRASAASRGQDVTPGMMVRMAPQQRSPFLLDQQQLHKSLILILEDNENFSVGAILNRPAARGIDIHTTATDSSQTQRTISLPLRFGGQYSIKGSDPLLWLHCNPLLRAAQVGTPLGPRLNGIFKCTAAHVTLAISQGLASPEDFLVVTGVTIWTKGEKGLARGIQGEIRAGKFQVVPHECTKAVWEQLSQQTVLQANNLMGNLAMAEAAWELGASKTSPDNQQQFVANSNNRMVSISGKQQEEQDNKGNGDDGVVFQTNVNVADLSDDAMRAWVATFLLGSPLSDDGDALL